MQFGWVKDGVRQTDDEAWSECDYYFGDEDDGAMATGWRLISITDSNYESDQPDPLGDTWDEEQDRYFWFKASGKSRPVRQIRPLMAINMALMKMDV